MKAVMMTVRPEWVAKILNGEKTIEIRKKFPSDYVGWVYIYVTNDRKDFLCEVDDYKELHEKGLAPFHYYLTPKRESKYHKCLNGKVVGRFWCDKVEEIKLNLATRFFTKSMNEEELLKQSCLTSKELENYLWSNICCGKAIHITEAKPFDKPKEIREFKHLVKYKNCSNCPYNHENMDGDICSKCEELKPLTRAPQSWCYVEVLL